jgi:prevent-host-death family protein
MLQAGVRNLKDHLSEYLRRVRQGERILITDRGRPIATLVGVDQEGAVEVTSTLVVRRINLLT